MVCLKDNCFILALFDIWRHLLLYSAFFDNLGHLLYSSVLTRLLTLCICFVSCNFLYQTLSWDAVKQVFIEQITPIWVSMLWTTSLKRTHVNLRLYFKIFSDITNAIIFLIGKNKMKIKTILKVKIHSLANKLCFKNSLEKIYIFYIFYFIKLYPLIQILIIYVSQSFLKKCLPENLLTKFPTNVIKWCVIIIKVITKIFLNFLIKWSICENLCFINSSLYYKILYFQTSSYKKLCFNNVSNNDLKISYINYYFKTIDKMKMCFSKLMKK